MCMRSIVCGKKIFPIHLCAYKDKFKEYMRMSKEMSHYLESRIEYLLDKPSTNFIRTPITTAEKLMATLR